MDVEWLFFCRYFGTEHTFRDMELSTIIGTLIEDPTKERGGNMLENIQPILTWSQDRIFAGGSRNVVLLVEWTGISSEEHPRTKSYKVVAREIELRIWLEPHVTFKRCYGCDTEVGERGELLFRLGKIQAGHSKFIGIELSISATVTGKYEALWLQWQYKKPSVERIRELSLKMLDLEYTHHTRNLGDSICFHVEKHLELLRTAEVFAEAMGMRTRGQHNQAYEQLSRHADKLLLLATRSGDISLLKEAETLYKRIGLEFQQRSKVVRN